MKKLVFVAVAAIAMVFASCGKKLSPAAEKAWADFKEVAAQLDSDEKIDKIESMEQFTELNKKWLEANKAMLDNSVEYAAVKPEIVDSMETIANKVNSQIQKVTEMLKAANELNAAANELDEAAENIEAAAEEVETEE